MKPEETPGREVRKAGRPSFMSGLTNRSMRRSQMLPSEVTATAA
jgi:hypothetical protein